VRRFGRLPNDFGLDSIIKNIIFGSGTHSSLMKDSLCN
jgi:hypothetical protein